MKTLVTTVQVPKYETKTTQVLVGTKEKEITQYIACDGSIHETKEACKIQEYEIWLEWSKTFSLGQPLDEYSNFYVIETQKDWNLFKEIYFTSVSLELDSFPTIVFECWEEGYAGEIHHYLTEFKEVIEDLSPIIKVYNAIEDGIYEKRQ